MAVLSKWPIMTGRSKTSDNDSQEDISLGVTSSMSNLSLLTEDPYASRNSANSSLNSSQASTSVSVTDAGPSLGTLIVVVMKAKNLYNRRAISKQNPYCSVRVAKHNDRTRAITRGGQAPVWDHETRFRLNADDDNRVLKLCVFDQNGSSTDIIGDAMIQLKPALERPPNVGYDDWFPIYFNKKYMGEVYLEMTFYPRKQHSRRSSAASSVSSLKNASLRNSLTEHHSRSASSDRSAAGSRSRSPAKWLPSPPRPSSPLKSSIQGPRLSASPVKHSESMPILREHALPYEQSPTASSGHGELPSRPVGSNAQSQSSHGTPADTRVLYGNRPSLHVSPTHSPYGSPRASNSSSSLVGQPSSGRLARPLPQLPPVSDSTTPVRPSLPAVPVNTWVPSQPYHHSSPSVDRAQADIFKQINDGYEASLFERLKP